MNKTGKILLVLLLALTLTLGVCACSAREYTVRFFAQEGANAIETQTVKSGETAAKPADPTRANHKFKEWVEGNKADAKAFDFSTRIKKDTDLYARWDLESYTITFNTMGGSEMDNQTVFHGSSFDRPQDPTKEGFAFLGWFMGEEEDAQEFDFDTKITGNTTLYARWIRAHNVNYHIGEGATFEGGNQSVHHGSALTRPQNDPQFEGHIFLGWYSDQGFETLYDFEETLTAELDLYAKWVSVKQVLDDAINAVLNGNFSANINLDEGLGLEDNMRNRGNTFINRNRTPSNAVTLRPNTNQTTTQTTGLNQRTGINNNSIKLSDVDTNMGRTGGINFGNQRRNNANNVQGANNARVRDNRFFGNNSNRNTTLQNRNFVNNSNLSNLARGRISSLSEIPVTENTIYIKANLSQSNEEILIKHASDNQKSVLIKDGYLYTAWEASGENNDRTVVKINHYSQGGSNSGLNLLTLLDAIKGDREYKNFVASRNNDKFEFESNKSFDNIFESFIDAFDLIDDDTLVFELAANLINAAKNKGDQNENENTENTQNFAIRNFDANKNLVNDSNNSRANNNTALNNSRANNNTALNNSRANNNTALDISRTNDNTVLDNSKVSRLNSIWNNNSNRNMIDPANNLSQRNSNRSTVDNRQNTIGSNAFSKGFSAQLTADDIENYLLSIKDKTAIQVITDLDDSAISLFAVGAIFAMPKGDVLRYLGMTIDEIMQEQNSYTLSYEQIIENLKTTKVSDLNFDIDSIKNFGLRNLSVKFIVDNDHKMESVVISLSGGNSTDNQTEGASRINNLGNGLGNQGFDSGFNNSGRTNTGRPLSNSKSGVENSQNIDINNNSMNNSINQNVDETNKFGTNNSRHGFAKNQGIRMAEFDRSSDLRLASHNTGLNASNRINTRARRVDNNDFGISNNLINNTNNTANNAINSNTNNSTNNAINNNTNNNTNNAINSNTNNSTNNTINNSNNSLSGNNDLSNQSTNRNGFANQSTNMFEGSDEDIQTQNKTISINFYDVGSTAITEADYDTLAYHRLERVDFIIESTSQDYNVSFNQFDNQLEFDQAVVDVVWSPNIEEGEVEARRSPQRLPYVFSNRQEDIREFIKGNVVFNQGNVSISSYAISFLHQQNVKKFTFYVPSNDENIVAISFVIKNSDDAPIQSRSTTNLRRNNKLIMPYNKVGNHNLNNNFVIRDNSINDGLFLSNRDNSSSDSRTSSNQ